MIKINKCALLALFYYYILVIQVQKIFLGPGMVANTPVVPATLEGET
jgi:hypothetical protein